MVNKVLKSSFKINHFVKPPVRCNNCRGKAGRRLTSGRKNAVAVARIARPWLLKGR